MSYISVNDWRKFQHYDPAKRRPPWIKVYTELMADDDWMELTEHQRSVLFHIWLSYATSGCHLRDSTSSLSRHFSFRVMRRDLETLEQAGFITIVASKTLAEGYQDARAETETEVEEELEIEKYRSSRVRSEVCDETRPDQAKAEEEDDELGWSTSNGYDIPTPEQRPNIERSDEMERIDPVSILGEL